MKQVTTKTLTPKFNGITAASLQNVNLREREAIVANPISALLGNEFITLPEIALKHGISYDTAYGIVRRRGQGVCVKILGTVLVPYGVYNANLDKLNKQ